MTGSSWTGRSASRSRSRCATARSSIDFTGTSPQVRGPFNCVPSGSLAAACWAVRALTDPLIPTNGGCFRPISLHLPPGSLVNPEEPAPVNARTSTIKRIAGVIVGALAPVMPDKAPAASAGELLVLAFGGQRRDGGRYVVGELIAGGSGAGAGADGVDVIETDATNCMNLPAEAMELEAPIRIHRVALRRDSGGAGEWRGGLGSVREYEVLDGEVSFSHRGERHFSAAPGLAGGEQRRVGAFGDPAGRRERGGDPVQDHDDARERRPPGRRDRRGRRLRRSAASPARACRRRYPQRQGEPRGRAGHL